MFNKKKIFREMKQKTILTQTYNKALKTFNKQNVIDIAIKNKTNPNYVIQSFCRKTLNKKDSLRLSEMLIEHIFTN